MTTFSEYRIPPAFFGPLQFVDYEGIGGNYVESVEDAQFDVKINGTNGEGTDGAASGISNSIHKKLRVR